MFFPIPKNPDSLYHLCDNTFAVRDSSDKNFYIIDHKVGEIRKVEVTPFELSVIIISRKFEFHVGKMKKSSYVSELLDVHPNRNFEKSEVEQYFFGGGPDPARMRTDYLNEQVSVFYMISHHHVRYLTNFRNNKLVVCRNILFGEIWHMIDPDFLPLLETLSDNEILIMDNQEKSHTKFNTGEGNKLIKNVAISVDGNSVAAIDSEGIHIFDV